jgi:hypothetical protein
MVNAGDRLGGFAKAHGLTAADRIELPMGGALLSEDDLKQEATATGALPGGERGTVCHLTYTTRSDDTTRTHHKTAVVIRVPESIGFAPYLAGGEPMLYMGEPTRSVDLDGGGKVRAADGIDDAWLTELLSPAFTHWLQRSPETFAW